MRYNYKQLWEQMRTIVVCNVRKSWPNKKIHETMASLEVAQQSKVVKK